MSFENSGYRQSRLLPENMESDLRVWANGSAGWSILAFVVFGLGSLLSWSAQDMNIGMATQDLRNIFGPPGAVFSDFMMKCFGATAMFLFLPLSHWGWMLKNNIAIENWKQRVVLWPFSVILLAGAAAFIPSAESWPLLNGYGGILGDVVLLLVSDFIGSFKPAVAGPLAFMLLAVSGCTALLSAMALTYQDFFTAFSMKGVHLRLRSYLAVFSRPLIWARTFFAGGISMVQVLAAPFAFKRSLRRHDAEDLHQPQFTHDEPPFDSVAAETATDAPDGKLPVSGELPDMPTIDLEDDGLTEESEDIAGRMIAERFAPRSARAGKTGGATAEPSASTAKSKKPRPGFFKKRNSDAAAISGRYQRPPLDMLKRRPASQPRIDVQDSVLRGNAGLLQDVLADFGIEGRIIDIKPGPVVTLFEFEPARGVKSSRVIALADDIARSMSAISTRVAIVPGRNVIGIELPNTDKDTVFLSELFASDNYVKSDMALPLALGKNIAGGPVVVDLARMPHLLIAGTTGSGKSVGINAMILSLLYALSPEQCKFIMIDPKMLELSVYNDIPHLLTPVVTDPGKAVGTLNWVVQEMEERYKKMSMLGVRSVQAFNSAARQDSPQERVVRTRVQTGYHPETGEAVYEEHSIKLEVLPYIVVVIDELADLMMVAGKDIEVALQRLAQMARAAGIHLIMATQRPSVDVVTGTIKANFPTRISFKVASKIDSRTILAEPGAEQLLGHGDMLYSTGPGQMNRIHGPLVEDEEVEKIIGFLRRQGRPQYVEAVAAGHETASASGQGGKAAEKSELYERAVAIVVRDRKVSTSYIQRRLSIGYNRAADLIDRMEEEGLISPPNRTGKRQILMGESEKLT